MKHLLAPLLSALVVAGGLVLPAQAQIPISGTSSGAGTITLVTPPSGYQQDFTSEGVDTLFGVFAGHSTSDRDLTDPLHQIISNGMFTETFFQGALFGTFTGTASAPTPGKGTFESTLVFTGGTGLFSNASGHASVTGTFQLISQTAFTLESSYVGVLTLVPEPGTLLFLTSMMLSYGALLRLRRGGRKIGGSR